jgi:hypothetical protein
MKIENLDQQLNIFLDWVDKIITIETPNRVHFTFKGYSKEDTLITAEISDRAYFKFKGCSKEQIKEIIRKRFESRHRNANVVKFLRIEPKVIPNFGKDKDCFLIGRIFYEVEEPNNVKKEGKMILYLYSKDEIWAGSEIKDPYGYMDLIFDEIEEGIIKGRDWKKIEEDTGLGEETLKKLSLKLKGYSRVKIHNLIREKLEEQYGSDPNIVAELLGIEGTILDYKKGTEAFVVGRLEWSINTNDKIGIDLPVMEFYMLSKDDIKVRWKE